MWRSLTLLSFAVLLAQPAACEHRLLRNVKREEIVEYRVTQVKELTKHSRNTLLPNKIKLAVGDKILTLYKVDYNSFDVQLFETNSEGQVVSSLFSRPTSALYQDVQSSAAVTLTSHFNVDLNKFVREIEGVFSLNDGSKIEIIVPSSRSAESVEERNLEEASNFHTITTIQSAKFSLSGDVHRASKLSARDLPSLLRSMFNMIPKHRYAADGAGNYYVETFILLDCNFYKMFHQSDEEVTYIIVTQFNAADMIYRSLQPQLNVKLILKGIYVEKTCGSNVWAPAMGVNSNGKCTTDASKSLSLMGGFGLQNFAGNNGYPSFDHLSLFVGCDVFDGTDFTVAGLATLAAICDQQPQFRSVSVVENLSTLQGITVLAHELGHSLGSNHDGESNSCQVADNYLMSTSNQLDPAVYKNQFKFSSCSMANFQQQLSNWNKCLQNSASNYLSDADWAKQLSQRPGARYPLDQQCVFVYGAGAKYCQWANKPVCGSLWCSVGDSCSSKTEVYAFDGTSCGTDMSCFRGDCLSNSQIPTA